MNIKQKAISGVCSIIAVIALVVTQAPELQTSQQGLEHIANAEGCRTNAYQCSADMWTIGLGHTANVKPNDNADIQQIANYFVADIKEAENVVRSNITQTPTQGEWDAMVSFVFNLGAGNFERSTLLKKFNSGQRAQACDEYLRWIYVNGQNCRINTKLCGGIVKRRELERNICLNGWG